MQDTAAVRDIMSGPEAIEVEFARIEAALARLGARGGDEVAELQVALAAERDVVAQLQDRLGILRKRGEAGVARAEAERDEARAALAQAESDLRRALAVIEALRAASAALRAACEEGGPEAAQVDGAMRAELDALGVQRDSDRREVDTVLAELRSALERA